MANDFQSIEDSLSKGILAAYLLGYDQATEENKPKLEVVRQTAKFSQSSKSKNYQYYPHSFNLAEGDPIDLNFEVKPDEAIDYFKRKRIVTKETFNKLEHEAKATAFMVGGIYREDMLIAFKTEIEDALESGQSQKYVVNQFKQILADGKHKELGDWHLENVFRTNMQMAYGVGRRKSMEDVSDDLPIWEYSAVMDDRTRPRHRALDGIQYPANHQFWNTYYPPIDFLCRCTVIAVADYRPNYNHQQPNADTTIIYDEKGLPAKAEYLTQVVDMKVTKFVGVPKIANLEKALTEAATAAKDARLLNHQNIPQVIVDAAREIRLSKKENLIGWDKEGNKVGHFVGDADEVTYPIALEPKMIGGFEIHNHPKEGKRFFESFSDGDIFGIVNLNLKAAYVTSQNFLYQIRQPKSGWDENAIDNILSSYEKHRKIITEKLTNSYKNSEIGFDELEDLGRHLIWKEIAKELKFKYKRFKLSEL